MTDLEIERMRAQVQHQHAPEAQKATSVLASLESLSHIAWIAFLLLTALVTGFVSYAVFQTKTNDRLDSVEKRLTRIETGQERILDALSLHRSHSSIPQRREESE